MPKLDLSLLLPGHVALAKSFASLALVFLFWDMRETVEPCHLSYFCFVPMGMN